MRPTSSRSRCSSVLGELAARGIKVVSNAGGIHPRACVAALEAMIAAAGLALKVAVVEGDDVSAQVGALAAAGARDSTSGEPLPARVLSANAYLGAVPIARALAAGADIVVTGRVVDSALVLGPLDARVRLERGRPRPARRRQPRRPHRRMRLPGDRRTLHRLGVGARLGDDRLSDRRVPRRRHVSHHQAGGHRRADRARRRRRAIAVRDRRPGRVRAARRDLRLPPGHDRAGRCRSRPRRRRARAPARPTRTRCRRRRCTAFAPPARWSSSASTR